MNIFTTIKDKIKQLNITLSPVCFSIIYSLFTVVIYNNYAFTRFYSNTKSLYFCGVMSLFLFVMYCFIFTICFAKHLLKPLSILLIICNSAILYFMKTYNVLFDDVMLLNVIETDTKEAFELINLKLVIHNIIYAIIPILLVLKIKIKYNEKVIKNIMQKVICCTISIIVAILLILLNYKNISSVVRQNKELKYAILPVNYFASVVSISKVYFKKIKYGTEINKIAQNAVFDLKSKNGKKNLVVFIVGEAARWKNFSLNGQYNIDTNKLLKQQDLIFFNDFYSCGTSTAISVPCMFSHRDRKHFKTAEFARNENLVDFLAKNSESVWVDNNSGCKNVCNRIKTIEYVRGGDSQFCDNSKKECYDEVLIEELQKQLKDGLKQDNNFVYLHQKGSHGPAYFLRVPDKFKVFQPFCKSEYFNDCTQEEITNSYNNTLYYTSFVINSIIEELKQHENEYNVALFYVSDHGQSLGEKNIYLHGMPYMIAPEEQKHIPAIFWMSDDFKNEFNLNTQCLKNIARLYFSFNARIA